MKHTRTAIVIGGGFYGSAIAIHLAQQGWNITLIEKEPELMGRASLCQSGAPSQRLPLSPQFPGPPFAAARTCPHFRDIYGEARFRPVSRPLRDRWPRFARQRASIISGFCRAAQIALETGESEDRALFDSRLVEAVYEVDEPAFNATVLRD